MVVCCTSFTLNILVFDLLLFHYDYCVSVSLQSLVVLVFAKHIVFIWGLFIHRAVFCVISHLDLPLLIALCYFIYMKCEKPRRKVTDCVVSSTDWNVFFYTKLHRFLAGTVRHLSDVCSCKLCENCLLFKI